MIPEQVWDADDVPERGLRKGKGTGAATPLAWAHAEYLMLLRSKRDGQPFERVECVYDRYVQQRRKSSLQVWRFNLPLAEIRAGACLRLQIDAPAVIHWSADQWSTVHDSRTEPTSFGVHYFDFPEEAYGSDAIVFTLYWPEGDRWEGCDYAVAVRQ